MSTEPATARGHAGSAVMGWRLRAGGAPIALIAVLGLLGLGCRQDMHDQPHYEPLEASKFFADGMASRQLPEGTVARGHLAADRVFETGKDTAGNPVITLPVPLTRPLVLRGRERFDIYCSPCHGRVGDGNGMAARRGFKHPPSFHQDRLRDAPVGYFYDVMTHGFGVMPSYAAAVPPGDRWAIAAYVRALQLSQRAHLAELPAGDQAAVQAAPTTTPAEGNAGDGAAAVTEHAGTPSPVATPAVSSH